MKGHFWSTSNENRFVFFVRNGMPYHCVRIQDWISRDKLHDRTFLYISQTPATFVVSITFKTLRYYSWCALYLQDSWFELRKRVIFSRKNKLYDPQLNFFSRQFLYFARYFEAKIVYHTELNKNLRIKQFVHNRKQRLKWKPKDCNCI